MLLCILKVHQNIHRNLLFAPIRSHLNPFHNFKLHGSFTKYYLLLRFPNRYSIVSCFYFNTYSSLSFYFIMLMVLDGEYKQQSFSLCNFPHSSVPFSPIESTVFSLGM